MPVPTIEQLMLRTKDAGGDCRIWTGSNNGGRTPSPKARYTDEQGENRYASVRRLVYEQHHGVTLAPDVLVSVTCESSLCICPKHLTESSKAAVARKTLADPVVKARHRRGLELVKQPLGKLDHGKAAIIRARRDEDADALASEFSVSRSLIFKVWQGKAWRDYSNPFSQMLTGVRAYSASEGRAA